MECKKHIEIGLFGSSYIAGVVVGTLIFPRLADVIGRKKVFYFGLLFYLLVVGLILIVAN